ncbi:MAG: hypothetical protein IKI58_08135 [Oscillospiraceae bacterium]|nr:hypothetical protein [Oscillospiraceae bacterium]
MEFLVEFIMELLGEIWGETVNSKRVPKVIRTVVFCLFWVPLLVLAGLLLWLMISGRNTLGCVLTGACVLLLTGFGIVMIRRIWKRVC